VSKRTFFLFDMVTPSNPTKILRRRVEEPHRSVGEIVEQIEAERRAEELRRRFSNPGMSVSEVIELLDAEKSD
jgi:AraC-like DNA-binding protein